MKVYAAANLQDAHILLGLLAGQGIRARVLNASAQGGVGEIPFSQAYPEIWLADARDAARARTVIAEFERPSRVSSQIHCGSCGEESPAHFAVCWNCGNNLEIAQVSPRVGQ